MMGIHEELGVQPVVDAAGPTEPEMPAGGFDLGALTGPLALRLTAPGDTFVALGTDVAVAVPPGEVAYADGSAVLTRHFVWRQARRGLIAPATRSAILMSEVLGEVDDGVPGAVLDDLVTGLRDHFGVAATTAIVDREQPIMAW